MISQEDVKQQGENQLLDSFFIYIYTQKEKNNPNYQKYYKMQIMDASQNK